MIKEIEITNFKSFGETVTIPIRPITLLFGANSSGKSSILQCLLMLAQSLSIKHLHYSLQSKGKLVDVGNYRNFVFQNNCDNRFRIKFNIEIDPAKIFEDNINRAAFLTDSVGGGTNTQEANFLLESLRPYSSFAIAYSFSGKTSPYLEETELFIGDGNSPVFSFGNRYPEEEKFILGQHDWLELDSWKCNRQHGFWENYAKTLSNINDQFLEQIVKECIEDHFSDDYFDLTDEEEKKGLSHADVRKDLESIIPLLKEHVTAERAVLFFKLLNIKKIFDIRGFLTFEFDNLDVGTLINNRATSSFRQRSGLSPGTLIPLLSGYVKDFLAGLSYQGPLRESPKRYYLEGESSDREIVEMCQEPSKYLLEKVNRELKLLHTRYRMDVMTLSNSEFEVDDIFVLQFFDKQNGCKASVDNVGFGFSQLLPLVIQSHDLSYEGHNTLISIEQPELHLHPGMQAELGDMFIRASAQEEHVTPKQFLLETHSEHLILRLLRRIRETTENELPDNVPPIRPEDVAVLYVQPGEQGAKVTHIPITEDGEFSRPWPQGFFPERAKELF